VGSAPEGSAPSADGDPTPPAKLDDQLARALAEKEELLQTLVRRQADFENFRKRVERERKEDHDRTVARVVEGLLPALDAFERALGTESDSADEEYRRGLELIYRQLWDALARLGVTRMETVGKRFDPHDHHAVERVESAEHPDGTVLEQLQPGYKLHNKVLRAAMVRVAVRPASRPAEVEPGVD
jgi:molecular chaperone GrpE